MGRDLSEGIVDGSPSPLQRGPFPKSRAGGSGPRCDLLVDGATRIAEPGAIDGGVAPAAQAVHLAVAMIQVDVAAGRAAGADRLGGFQEPDPHLETEIPGEERPDG